MLVLDTGLHTVNGKPEHPDLAGCAVIHEPWLDPTTPGAWDDEDEPDDDHRGQLDHQGGHGTFITGIIRQLCPDARVHHAGVLSSFGDGDDVSVIAAIQRAHAWGVPIDIVVMSFGAYSIGDRPPPMTATIRRLLPDALVVASAGNDATRRPFFPAALPEVVAVGALDSAGRASFSNYGPWVDACAPAVDVVSTFFTDFPGFDGLGGLERHELRRAEGGRRRRPRDVPEEDLGEGRLGPAAELSAVPLS